MVIKSHSDSERYTIYSVKWNIYGGKIKNTASYRSSPQTCYQRAMMTAVHLDLSRSDEKSTCLSELKSAMHVTVE